MISGIIFSVKTCLCILMRIVSVMSTHKVCAFGEIRKIIPE